MPKLYIIIYLCYNSLYITKCIPTNTTMQAPLPLTSIMHAQLHAHVALAILYLRVFLMVILYSKPVYVCSPYSPLPNMYE